MDEVVIPDGMPSLASGSHDPGSGEACVMEMVSVLAGEEWTDYPLCTHPMLARAAICVNDSLCDEYRHLLVPAIGRLLGTGTLGNHDRVEAALEAHYARQVRFEPWAAYFSDRHPYLVTRALAVSRREGAPGWVTPEEDARRCVRWLMGVLDVYDETVGRTSSRPLTDEDVVRLREVLV